MVRPPPGLTAEHAETSAHALDSAVRDAVATKRDVETPKVQWGHKNDGIEMRLELKMDHSVAILRQEIAAQKIDLVKWLVPLLQGQVALAVALMKPL